MDIEKIKRWHWLLLGLIVGALMACTRVFWGVSLDNGHPEVENAHQFEEMVMLHRPPDDAVVPSYKLPYRYLDNIVVHLPTKGIHYPMCEFVTGEIWQWTPPVKDSAGKITHPSQTRLFRPFLYEAPIPYYPKPNFLTFSPFAYQLDSTGKKVRLLPVDGAKDVNATALAAPFIRVRDLEDEVDSANRKISRLGREKTATEARELKEAQAPEAPAPATSTSEPRTSLVIADEIKQAQLERDNFLGQLKIGPKVQDYLKALSQLYPQLPVHYRVAWEENTTIVFAIWMGGAAFVIGGIWPSFVGLLIGAGFGRRREKEEEYDLSRFKGTKSKAKAKTWKPASPAVTDEDMQRLHALEAQLEKSLAGGLKRDAPAVPVGAAAAPAPVRQLSAGPLETAAVPKKSEPSKVFGGTAGDFYPTEVYIKKKEGEDKTK